MPTVHREEGFKVIIYPNDHLPEHVHVFRGGGQVIITLGSDVDPPSLYQVYGDIRDKDVVKALKIVTANQFKLLSAWRTIHG